MTRFISLTAAVMFVAGPALAASKNPFSADFWKLSNTDFIVALSFVIFVAILVYFKVPGLLTGWLDARSAGIQSELDEARALREEAQSLLASYERKQADVKAQADRIVAKAKEDAAAAADKAKADLKFSIERRMTAAEEQIASAQARAIKDVRDQAAAVAVKAAQSVIAANMTSADGSAMLDAAISEVDAKLH